ncbi:unnamed protein product, partial [Porites evermanni]
NCFATTSDKKIFAGAKGRSLFFFDASTLETLGGPFEVSRDVIQRINGLEFSPDDKFVFFGRLDKWFSVGRSCVKDFRQFSENPGHHYWGRILSNGQHMVVKRNHFSDLPETCETKRCIEDILSLWALKEIDGGPDKEWTCSFRQLPEMVAGFSTMGIETSSLLRRLGTNLMSCEVDAMHGANYRSCYFCDQLKELKELTDPSKETSLKHVRQLIIKLYRWIFRYQVWNLETGRPLLQDVFNQCVQFNPFTYFCHVTSAFDKWGKDIGCGGVDQVMSVCNIAVVTAIDTFFRLRRLKEVWKLKEELQGEEEKKLIEMVEKRLKEVWKLEEELHGKEEMKLGEMAEKRLKEVWKLEEEFHREEEVTEKIEKMLKEEWKLAEKLKRIGEKEKKAIEQVEENLKDVWELKEQLHAEEEKRLIEMVEKRLKEVWKLKEELHGEEKKLIEMVEKRLKEVWKLKEELHGEEEKKSIELVEKRLKEVWKLKEELHGEEEKKLIEMVEKRLKEFWKSEEELHGEEKKNSEKQEYRFTQTKYLTFTYDDLYVVFLSHEKLLHALSLQTGTIFTSVSGRNCCYFTRERRVGYLFRSGTEERAIFLSSLLNPCKFFSVLPGQDGEVGETTAAIFSSSDTVKSISSESLITSWRLLDHNLGFSFERFSESSSAGSRSQVIKIQNCVFSIDGKLLAFQQHTQIKQCLVEDFEKSQCIVFEADLSVTDLCLTFSLDGVFLLFSIRDNCSGQHFYVWHVQEKVLSKSFSSPCLLSIDSFCLSSDNRNLILCGDEYEIEIWEFSLYPLHLLKRICVERSFNPVKFSHCAVSQDTELLVCCLANVIFVYSLQVADIHSSKRVLRGHVGKIEFCKFLKRNRYLISYAVDGMVFLWDISESKAIGFARIAKGREKIICMAVSPDEDRAVCFISPSRVCV